MMSYAKKVTGMLQDYYAERLEVAYILHINWFFRLMYGIFKPFLSKKTRDKIKIMGRVSEMRNYFDDENLLACHGGTSEFDTTPDFKGYE